MIHILDIPRFNKQTSVTLGFNDKLKSHYDIKVIMGGGRGSNQIYLQILEYPCQFPGRSYDDQQI